MKTPVLLLIFNRIDTLQEVMQVLQQVKPPHLFVAGDGARAGRTHEVQAVQEVRRYVIENINWECEVHTLFRETNLGCGLAVSGAIDWFFTQVEDGIILEDDCVADESFFSYCEELLKKYRHDESIMSISGTHFGEAASIESDYYFSKYPLMWGWATWKRAWERYEFNTQDSFEVLNRQQLSFRSKLYWRKIFEKLSAGKIDTWDYQWLLTIWRNDGFVCRPKVNLVRNIGFGPGATHTYLENNKSSKLIANKLPTPLRHPPAKIIFDNGDRMAERDWVNLSVKSLFGLYYPGPSALVKRLIGRSK